MFPVLLAFLVWLFATGKYNDWAALVGLNPISGNGAPLFNALP